MITINATTMRPIRLGHAGENEAVRVAFALDFFQREFPGGSATMLMQRSRDAEAYPVPLTVEGASAYWLVSDTDTAMPGYGRAELQWRVGDVLVKSSIYDVVVAPSLPAGDTPPDEPSKRWFDDLQAQVGDLEALETDTKENLVEAINEVAQFGGGGGNTKGAVRYDTRQKLTEAEIRQVVGNLDTVRIARDLYWYNNGQNDIQWLASHECGHEDIGSGGRAYRFGIITNRAPVGLVAVEFQSEGAFGFLLNRIYFFAFNGKLYELSHTPMSYDDTLEKIGTLLSVTSVNGDVGDVRTQKFVGIYINDAGPGLIASATAPEIKKWAAAGYSVVAAHENIIMPLVAAGDDNAVFATTITLAEGDILVCIPAVAHVGKDGGAEGINLIGEKIYPLMPYDADKLYELMNETLDKLGEVVAPIMKRIVTVTEKNGSATCDQTFADISAALDAGLNVMLQLNSDTRESRLYPFSTRGDGYICFAGAVEFSDDDNDGAAESMFSPGGVFVYNNDTLYIDAEDDIPFSKFATAEQVEAAQKTATEAKTAAASASAAAAEAKAAAEEAAKKEDIPSTLPNPNKLKFTGAVSAEYDGSKEVSVNIPGGGSGLPASTTEDAGKLLRVNENGNAAWETVLERIPLVDVTMEEAGLFAADFATDEVAAAYRKLEWVITRPRAEDETSFELRLVIAPETNGISGYRVHDTAATPIQITKGTGLQFYVSLEVTPSDYIQRKTFSCFLTPTVYGYAYGGGVFDDTVNVNTYDGGRIATSKAMLIQTEMPAGTRVQMWGTK